MTSSHVKAIFIPALILFVSAGLPSATNGFSYQQAGSTHVYNEDFGKKQKENFKQNNVHSISGYTFVYQNGTPVKNGVKTSLETFDKRGNLIEDIVFSEKGETSSEFTNSYNDDGILLKSIGMVNHKPRYNFWTYHYNDSTGTLTKSHAKSNLYKEKWVYKFDKEGNKTEEEYYDADGYLLSRKAFKYDEKNRLLEKIEFDAYDNLFEKVVYLYDAKGNNTTQNIYNADSEILKQYTLIYDDNGNLTTRITANSKGVTQNMTVYLYQFFPEEK